MAKSSKKRSRTDEDVAENHEAKPVLKKSKLDSTGEAKVTKKSSKVKEAKPEPATTENGAESKKEKKEKKDKKAKKDKKRTSEEVELAAEDDEAAPASPSKPEPQAEESANGDASADKKSKKKKNKDKKKKGTEPEPDAEPTTTAAEESATQTATSNGKPTRFICFVGNLPFTATADDVRAHFATLQPTSVRLLTQRDDPSKSRGIAFVEFGRYDHMKTCLEKFHHTEFDDGKSAARRINVELTAGGGGKTAARQDKIKQKNAKLNEERANRMQREEKAKQEKGSKTQEQRDEEAIHPSRRGRVPYGRK